MTRTRRDVLACAALAAAVFAPTALLCGLYLDDYSFLAGLTGLGPRALWRAFIEYVPGRNLHVPVFWALIEATRGSVAAMHAVSVVLDAAAAAAAYLLALRITGRRSVALASAAMFVLMPHHGETHFWITLIPQCLVPLLLTLGAFMLALDGARLAAALGLYALALFTYDQVFFLWPLLLAAAWSADRRMRPRRYAFAAAVCLSLNAAHTLARYLSPYASGGRPVIRVGDVPARSWDALRSLLKGTLPWPSTPQAPAWLVALAAAGALCVAWWWVREVRASADEEETRETALLRAAAFGLAWAALAYLPNLFWYISPRHGLIPSLGWSIAACSLGALVVRRWRPLGRAAPALGALWIAMAAVADVCEGTQWVDSARLRERFYAEARRLAEPVDSLFLVGAPRYLRRAPAFNLYHDVALAAGMALGRGPIPAGDYHAAPTRRGLVSFHDLTVWGPDQFRWSPAAESNVVAYRSRDRGFECVSALDLTAPGGASFSLPVRASSGCAARLNMTLDAALVESRPIQRPRGAAGGAALELVRAEAAASAGGTRLTFDWRVEALPGKPLALVPRLLDSDGKTLLDSAFPSRTLPRGEPVLWPLVDDLARERPASAGLRQMFDLAKPLPSGAARVEVDVYEVDPQALPRRIGRYTAPL